MRISITLKTLIMIVTAMLIAVLSFNSGYFKSQLDASKYSDKYTVSVEKTPGPEELAELEAALSAEDKLMVNINTATAEELDKLNGIGPALAERVIQYREEHGAFENKYDIMDVSGIGSGIYEKIKENICVN